MYNRLFCFLLAFCQQLPLPFCDFENLCFQAETSTFFTEKKAIASEKGRGYFLKALEAPIESKPVAGTIFFLFESQSTRTYLAHFFHLLEHICALWSFYGDEHSEEVRRIVLAADGGLEDWHWEGPNEINRHLLRALFPNAEVKTWRQFLEECEGKTLCFERALTSDRALCFASAECMSINKMLGAAYRLLSQEALQRLSDRVHAYVQDFEEIVLEVQR